jgi:hypothetical protein
LYNYYLNKNRSSTKAEMKGFFFNHHILDFFN